MGNFKSIHDYCDDLESKYTNLTDYEKLSIAVQIQRNDILKAGFTVSQSDRHSSALEAIAIQLGMRPEGSDGSYPPLIDNLHFLARCIKNKQCSNTADALKNEFIE